MLANQSYKGKTPVTASPATNSTSTLSRTVDQKAWLVSVSVQDAYILFESGTPSSTSGITVPAGSVLFIPVMGDILCRAATTGAIVNAIPME